MYRFLISLLLVVLSCHATADKSSRGFAFAVGAGISKIEDTDDQTDTFRGSDVALNLDFEYRFSRYFALGMSAISLGEDTDDFNGAQTTIDVGAFGFYARGMLPINDQLAIYLRYGETDYSVDMDPGFGRVFPFSERAHDFGAGIDWTFSGNWALRFETRVLNGVADERGALTTIGIAYGW